MLSSLSSRIFTSMQLKCIGRVFNVAIFFVSVVTLGVIIVDYGFVLDAFERSIRDDVYVAAWWIYLAAYLFRVLFQWSSINRKTVFMTFLSGLMLFLTGLPKFVGVTGSVGWFDSLLAFCNHKYFQIVFLGLYSIIEFSKGVVSIINKRTNPAMLMAVGFAIVIVFGALLLLLPRSTVEGVRLAVIDGLFVSTSAVCVTGLSPVDIATVFTLEGQIIIACLIQIGGLGVMTITSFFALFFMGGTGLYNQFALRDMIGSETFSSLISTLLYIVGFTFFIEGVGALCIWLSIHGTLNMSLNDEIFFAIFHSVSAFCNAGFSTLTGNLGNSSVIHGHNGFYIIISVLIVLGGIGFPILVNLWRAAIKLLFKRKIKSFKYAHIANVNTKLVLVVTMVLIVGGTLVVAFCEWYGAFAGMSVGEKLAHSFF